MPKVFGYLPGWQWNNRIQIAYICVIIIILIVIKYPNGMDSGMHPYFAVLVAIFIYLFVPGIIISGLVIGDNRKKEATATPPSKLEPEDTTNN
jgi:sugar phosphate permease